MWPHCEKKKNSSSFPGNDCEEGFLESELKKLELDMAEKFPAIIHIFIDLYGSSHAFLSIANPEYAKAGDLLVMKVLSRATNSTMAGVLALQLAAKMGSLDCLRYILDLGCKVDATDALDDDTRETALLKAVAEGHLEMVKLLHEAGADLNFTIDPDWGFTFCETPLLYAATHKHEAVV